MLHLPAGLDSGTAVAGGEILACLGISADPDTTSGRREAWLNCFIVSISFCGRREGVRRNRPSERRQIDARSDK